jgi:hypothetical protein
MTKFFLKFGGLEALLVKCNFRRCIYTFCNNILMGYIIATNLWIFQYFNFSFKGHKMYNLFMHVLSMWQAS